MTGKPSWQQRPLLQAQTLSWFNRTKTLLFTPNCISHRFRPLGSNTVELYNEDGQAIQPTLNLSHQSSVKYVTAWLYWWSTLYKYFFVFKSTVLLPFGTLLILIEVSFSLLIVKYLLSLECEICTFFIIWTVKLPLCLGSQAKL